jgi:glutamyl-tRNA reductase
MTQKQNRFLLWGIDYHRATTSVREKVHIDDETAARLVAELKQTVWFISAVMLSTCNRTEFYIESRGDTGVAGREIEADFIAALTAVGVAGDLFRSEYAYHLSGRDAMAHLYRVNAGLESMMIGEPQISGQVKDAYRLGRELQGLGPVSLRVFQGAFRAGKKVRTDTGIGSGAVSVAFAAAETVRRELKDLSGKRVLLIGAGSTGSLGARHLLQKGVSRLLVANRSRENAELLVATLNQEYSASIEAVPFEDLTTALSQVDVVLTTTGSPEPIVTFGMITSAMAWRPTRRLMVIDIAVPSDVEPAVAALPNVNLQGLDDLESVVAANLAARKKEIPLAYAIIEKELGQLDSWLADMRLMPTVSEFRAFLEELKEKEIGVARKKTSPEVAAAVEESLQGFIKKLMRRPVENLRSGANQGMRDQDMISLRRLFELDRGELDGSAQRR